MKPDPQIIQRDVGHDQVRSSRYPLLQHNTIVRLPSFGHPHDGNEFPPFLLAELADWFARDDGSRSAIWTVVSVLAPAAVVAAKVSAALADSCVVVRPVHANICSIVAVSVEIDGGALSASGIFATDSVGSDWTAGHLLQTLSISTGSRDLGH